MRTPYGSHKFSGTRRRHHGEDKDRDDMWFRKTEVLPYADEADNCAGGTLDC